MASEQFAQLYINWETNQGQLNSDLRKSERSIESTTKRIGDRMGDLGQKLTKSITLPILGAASALATLADRNRQTQIEMVRRTNASTDAISDLNTLAQEMGQDIPESINSISNSLAELDGALDLTNSQMRTIVEASSDFSAIMGGTLLQTTTSVIDAMNNFNIPLSETEDFLNRVAFAARSYNTNAQSLLETVSTLDINFEAFGLTLDEQIGLFAALESQGLSARRFFNTLERGIDSGNETYAEYFERLQDIQNALEGLSTSQRIQQLEELFGRRASEMEGMFRTIDFEDLSANVRQGAQSLSEIRDEFTSLGDLWQLLVNNVYPQLISLGENVIEMMLGWSDQIIRVISNLSALAQRIDQAGQLLERWREEGNLLQKILAKLADYFSVTLIALGPLLIVFNAIMNIFSRFIGLGTKVGKVFGKIGEKIKDFAVKSAGAAQASRLFSKYGVKLKISFSGWLKSILSINKNLRFLAKALGTVGIVITGVITYVKLIIDIFEDWQTYLDYVRGVFIETGRVYGKVANSIRNFILGIVKSIQNWWQELLRGDTLWSQFANWGVTAFEKIGDAISWVSEKLGFLYDSVVSFGKAFTGHFIEIGKNARIAAEQTEKLDQTLQNAQNLEGIKNSVGDLEKQLVQFQDTAKDDFSLLDTSAIRESIVELNSLEEQLDSIDQSRLGEGLDEGIYTKIENLRNVYKSLTPEEQALNAFDNMQLDLQETGDSAESATPQLRTMADELERIREQAESMRSSVRPFENFRSEIEEMSNIKSHFPEIVTDEVFSDLLLDRVESLTDAQQDLLFKNKEYLETLPEIAQAELFLIQNQIRRNEEIERSLELMEQVQNQEETLMENVFERGDQLNQDLEDFNALLNNGSQGITELGRTMIEIGTSAGNSLVEGLGRVTASTGTVISGIEDMKEIMDSAQDVGKDSFKSLITSTGGWNSILNVTLGLISMVTDFLGIMGDEGEEELRGMDKMMAELGEKLEDWGEQLTDTLVDFMREGRLEIRNLVEDIMADLAQVGIQTAVTDPIVRAVGSLFADGGVFTNSVVSKATAFPMGVMGEAGPEAIMPLTKTSGGQLGVKSTGSNSSTINIINQNDSQIETKEYMYNGEKMIDFLIKDKVIESIHSGEFDSANRQVYNQSRRPVKR